MHSHQLKSLDCDIKSALIRSIIAQKTITSSFTPICTSRCAAQIPRRLLIIHNPQVSSNQRPPSLNIIASYQLVHVILVPIWCRKEKIESPCTGVDAYCFVNAFKPALHRMCNIIHQRQYNFLLRLDALFQFTEFAKQQQKFLEIIHGLTSRVIKKRKAESPQEKSDSPLVASVMKELKKGSTERSGDKDVVEQKMRYVRDDLDDIDENDVGETIDFTFFRLSGLYWKFASCRVRVESIFFRSIRVFRSFKYSDWLEVFELLKTFEYLRLF